MGDRKRFAPLIKIAHGLVQALHQEVVVAVVPAKVLVIFQ